MGKCACQNLGILDKDIINFLKFMNTVILHGGCIFLIEDVNFINRLAKS